MLWVDFYLVLIIYKKEGMQKLSIASVLCLGSLINAVEINTQEKFLGLPLKMTPAVDSVDSINPTD
jgi:hypothetical protein